jgi:hypothetical protein
MNKLSFAIVVLRGALACAQTALLVDRPFHNQRLDPALDQIIAPDARLEVLGRAFRL